MTSAPKDRPLAAEALRARYRERLVERIGALESALERLGDDDGAEEEIRRLAHLLRGSGTSYGYPAITARAGDTEDAESGALETEARALLDELRATLSAGDPEIAVVLVVEDDPEIRHLLEVVLAGDGREILSVDAGEAARAVLDAREVDLVVLDLVLPDQDGRRLLRHIRERPATAHVPVIVVSGHEAAAVQTECFRLGADAYFRKPFDPGTLEAAVGTHLDRAARQVRESREDPVTGLLNRAGLTELWVSRDADADDTLAIVEVDGFDRVEMRHGWSAAEAALKGAASVVERTLAAPGRVGRWEGESFVALISAEPDAVRERLERVLEELRRTHVSGPDGETFRLTASAGLGAARGEVDLGEVLDVARAAVFRARAAGGNRVGDDEEEPTTRRRVIVAEDDDIVASLLRHRLEREGFDVEWHSNGADAYEAALRGHPDLIILDVRMPGMDGFELLERLRKVAALQDVPVVLLTSMGSEADLVRGFRLGADDYVLKPFRPTEFLARVRRLVGRAS